MSTDVLAAIKLATNSPDFPEVPLIQCGPGSSSMDAAWELMADGRLPEWGAVLMERQTSGRGRMGRVWQSPAGHIYGALNLPPGPPFDGPGASLALALIIAEGLADFGWETRIKWPNDIIFQNGKAGGILLESRGKALVAGVGLNLVEAPEGPWRAERDPGAPPPAALPFSGPPLDLWGPLVKKLVLLYSAKFGGRAMREIVPLAEKRLLWLGRKVWAERPAADPPAPESGLTGHISGLGPEGQLCLSNQDADYQLWSGSIFLIQGNDHEDL
ncbi:biotin--[acetyl-CoA-carboxylase] ligase [Deltaproteobacteria bacterium OttesenSCG-928-M10]|nr:biotin--[acetyl-CoA-carboxylase] ligase [Deltaproteobacteria bacterium OttesenSCG-928-M10]